MISSRTSKKDRRYRLLVFVVATSFLSGAATGVAFGRGTTNGIYHGIYNEQRSTMDYHHTWVEHSHGGGKSTAMFSKITGSIWCEAGESAADHVHCSKDHNNLAWSDWLTSPGDLHPAWCSEGWDAYAIYSDGHGICPHYHVPDTWDA